MKTKLLFFFSVVSLLLTLSSIQSAVAQTCYPTIIVGAASDTTTLMYDDANHVTSITDPFVIYLVAGAEKAKIVKAVLSDQAMLPAAMIRPTDGELIWLADQGGLLEPQT